MLVYSCRLQAYLLFATDGRVYVMTPTDSKRIA